MNTSGFTKDQLIQAAHALGRMHAETRMGDFYDIVDGFTKGYAEAEADVYKWQLVALSELRAVVEDMTQWRVDDAREAGQSWQQIGDALEISRQAAQQKYGK